MQSDRKVAASGEAHLPEVDTTFEFDNYVVLVAGHDVGANTDSKAIGN